MRYINKYSEYKLIKEEEELSKGEILSFQLRDYNTKKTNLKNLVMSNYDTDKDITKAYTDIVQENPFLQKEGQIAKIEAGIKKTEDRLTDNKEILKSLEDDLKLVDKLSDTDDKEDQKSSLEERINEKNDDTKSIEDKIKELTEQLGIITKELDDLIKVKTAELREIEKSPFNI